MSIYFQQVEHRKPKQGKKQREEEERIKITFKTMGTTKWSTNRWLLRFFLHLLFAMRFLAGNPNTWRINIFIIVIIIIINGSKINLPFTNYTIWLLIPSIFVESKLDPNLFLQQIQLTRSL